MSGVYSTAYRLQWSFRGHRRAREVSLAATLLTHGNDGICYYCSDFPRAPTWRSGGGGQLKLIHLSSRWPHVLDGARCCYIASSAADIGAHVLAQTAREKGIKVILNQDGITYPGWYGRGWSGPNSVEKALLRTADAVVLQSRFVERCLRHHWGDFDQPTTVILNPVDTTRFRPRLGGLATSPLVVLCRFPAGWHRRHRLRLAVEAIGHLGQEGYSCLLRLVGADAGSDNTRRIMQWLDQEAWDSPCLKRGLQAVRIDGAYRWQDAPAVLAQAHICLHPAYNDPCPNFVAECLACGVPIVGLSCGGAAELAGDAGEFVSVEERYDTQPLPSAERVAAAIVSIADRLPEMAEKARSRAETHLNLEGFFEQHNRLFQQLT